MRVLLVSDSHGEDDLMLSVIAKEKPDAICHMGDGGGSYMKICRAAGVPVYMVSGNCDFRTDLPGILVVNLEGHKILITHGHLFSAFSDYYDDLCDAAKVEGCEMVFFGHIHMPVLEEKDGITIVNPGSITRPRQTGRRKTYMMMDIEEGKRPKFRLESI